jgi:DNA-binding CsgD family transcriptional regulator
MRDLGRRAAENVRRWQLRRHVSGAPPGPPRLSRTQDTSNAYRFIRCMSTNLAIGAPISRRSTRIAKVSRNDVTKRCSELRQYSTIVNQWIAVARIEDSRSARIGYAKDNHGLTEIGLTDVPVSPATWRGALSSARHEALGLSRREAEVLGWIAEGKTTAMIGIILGASARTVQHHLDRIYRKLGVENRTAAAARALRFLQERSPPKIANPRPPWDLDVRKSVPRPRHRQRPTRSPMSSERRDARPWRDGRTVHPRRGTAPRRDAIRRPGGDVTRPRPALQVLDLIEVPEDGSNCCDGGGGGNRTHVRKPSAAGVYVDSRFILLLSRPSALHPAGGPRGQPHKSRSAPEARIGASHQSMMPVPRP